MVNGSQAVFVERELNEDGGWFHSAVEAKPR